MILQQPPAFPKGWHFKWEKELKVQLGLVWPGRSWQSYFSLGVLEAMGSEAEACHSSKIVLLFNKKPPLFTKPPPLEYAYGWGAANTHITVR